MAGPDAAPSRPLPRAAPGVEWFENRSILTKTGGFLKTGYTHSLNPYLGCSFGGSLCGTFCYAQHNQWIVKGRPWRLYAAKRHAVAAYGRDFDRLKRPRRGAPKPLRVYMSSSTDPYLPQERELRLTRGVLEAMVARPPDVLVLQTRSLLVRRDLDLLRDLAARVGELWLSVTVETDRAGLPGFPPHASPPADRLDLLAEARAAGIPTQATVAPLLPIADLDAFGARLDAAADRVVVDHYLLGDGSGGLRTRRTGFVERLEAAGFGEWAGLEPYRRVVAALRARLGPARVLESEAGFNAVGR